MINQADQKIIHLHKIIDTTREIDRLVFSEKKPEPIITNTCSILVNTRGYHLAWIALFDDDKVLTSFAGAGENNQINKIQRLVNKSQLFEKLVAGVTQLNQTVTTNIPAEFTADIDTNVWTSFLAPIADDKKVHGLLCAAIPAKEAEHPKEELTFTDICNNLGMALGRIYKDDELKTSEIRYRNLINSLNDALFILQDGEIKFVNQSLCILSGYSKEELLGQDFTKFVAPEERAKVKEIHAKRLHGDEKQLNYESVALTKPGHLVPVDVTVVSTSFDDSPALQVMLHDNSELKKTLEKLKEREAHFRFLSEASFEGIIIHDNGKILEINETLLRITGYSREELIGKNLLSDFILEKDWPKALESLQKDIPKPFVVSARKKDRTIGYAEIEARSIPFKGKNVRIAAVRDISERYFLQEAVKESREQLNRLLDNLPGVAYNCKNDESWSMNFMSEGCFSLFGYHPKELTNGTVRYDDLIHPDDKKYVWNTIQDSIAEKKSYELEYRIKTKNDTEKWVWERGKAIYNDKEILLEGFISDITRRKTLERANEMLSKAIESSPASIVITDADGNIEYVNPFFEEKSGYHKAEVLGQNPRILKSGEQDKAFYKEMWQTIKAGNIWFGEFLNKKKNGERYWEQANISPIFDQQKRITQFIAVKEDITEKKQTLKELREAKEKAEQSDKLKSSFLANMSHEIRTPMNGILGFTELLKEPDLTTEQQHEFINVIQTSGDRMLSTINDIIDISKIESGMVNLNMQDINLSALINELYVFFQPSMHKKGIDFKVNENNGVPVSLLHTDPDKLNSILTNLIKNAYKFTASGTIEFGYTLSNKSIHFYVHDTGVGIPQNRQQAIFDRFVQADVADSRVFEGSGLGLSITKSYTEMLNGSINLKSNVGEGTTFNVSLPIVLTTNETKISENDFRQNFSTLINKKLKILIAEDDPISIELLKLLVNEIASEIIIANNGQEAVQLVQENADIDLLLMDIKMPILDGFNATEKIRAFNNNVKIIAQSAFAQPEDIRKAQKSGCNDFVSKPIHKHRLFESIQRLFN
ncbi:PAS domain S-box protein [uncultured Draconibacterium sp.]|uniref:PAS domain S-box protein n=1 Tax=uncultured Draconibacterium sp. TaxID=1573823 RepID=UPI0025E5E7C4|nr:PAS domain S-box protein [uncultured Draconibacterium sp.]